MFLIVVAGQSPAFKVITEINESSLLRRFRRTQNQNANEALQPFKGIHYGAVDMQISLQSRKRAELREG